MSFITALLIGAGRSFGTGAMQTLGCAVASMVVPIIAPRIIGAVKGIMKVPVQEEVDPDLC